MFCGLDFYFVDFRIKFLDNRFFIYLTYHNICVCNLASSSSSQFHNSIFKIEDILSIKQLHCFGTISILHSNIWLYIDKDFTKWIIWSFTFLFLMIHTTKLCCNGHICKIMITYLYVPIYFCASPTYIHIAPRLLQNQVLNFEKCLIVQFTKVNSSYCTLTQSF